MSPIDLIFILIAAFVASASPGPATLAIAGTSMAQGRMAGLALAAGVTSGSWTWSVAAAMGLGAVMLAHGWLVEVLRYLGAAYLLWLAVKSARSALTPGQAPVPAMKATGLGACFGKGLTLHLTNPKAIFFFGSLFAVGTPAGATTQDLAVIVVSVGLQSFVVFHGYALLFSLPRVRTGYARLRRVFEAVFAAIFAAAGLHILRTRAE